LLGVEIAGLQRKTWRFHDRGIVNKVSVMSAKEKELLKQRRRALIKAVGAAPVVLTLPNGAAFAATSLTCADNTRGAAAASVVEGTDTWVRVSVQKLKFKLGNKVVYGFSYGNNYYTVAGGAATAYFPPTGTKITSVTNGRYGLLVDYNAPGVYGVYPADSSIGNPIAGASCWNSVNPNGPHAGTGNLV
jgi:hypothetical protein